MIWGAKAFRGEIRKGCASTSGRVSQHFPEQQTTIIITPNKYVQYNVAVSLGWGQMTINLLKMQNRNKLPIIFLWQRIYYTVFTCLAGAFFCTSYHVCFVSDFLLVPVFSFYRHSDNHCCCFIFYLLVFQTKQLCCSWNYKMPHFQCARGPFFSGKHPPRCS